MHFLTEIFSEVFVSTISTPIPSNQRPLSGTLATPLTNPPVLTAPPSPPPPLLPQVGVFVSIIFHLSLKFVGPFYWY